MPNWCEDLLGKTAALTSDQYGPPVDSIVGTRDTAILGRYIEDHEYKGDVGMLQGTHFDLDQHNGRWCKTPEFTHGTYAYFVTIADDGTLQFPYAAGPVFYGKLTAQSVDNIPLAATTHFKGGPSVGAQNPRLEVDSNDIALSWAIIKHCAWLHRYERALTTLMIWQCLVMTMRPFPWR